MANAIATKTYESFTTALWNNICNYYYDIGGNDGYTFAHEHFISGRPADQVLMRLFKYEDRDNNTDLIGTIPFCVLEFKAQANPGTDAFQTAQAQVKQGLQGLAEKFIAQKENLRLHKPAQLWGYPLWGIVGAGNQVLFYRWDFEEGRAVNTGEMNAFEDAGDVDAWMRKIKGDLEGWMENQENHLMLRSFVLGQNH
ncbi:MAG: hypothetical protein M1831_001669 [Alyxoria varia]|nr:MAG: hypothetical protein M1831_001669 [Alyxoria varia]